MKQNLLTFLMLLGSLGIYAQAATTDFRCGYDQWTRSPRGQQLLEQQQNDTYERVYQRLVKAGEPSRGAPPIYTVPIVIHIIHACEPIGSDLNPTDASIQETVQLWSDRFRHTSGEVFDNPFSGVDTEIQFCLATSDPVGNYTNGIIRHSIPELTIGDDSPEYYDAVATLNWDPELYFNVYFVADLGGNIGGISIGNSILLEDLNAGLFAHEAGHHFGLRHTFNNGCFNGDCLVNGDRVCDTPPDSYAGKAVGGCNDPYNSCTTDADDSSDDNPYYTLGDANDMPENYMDYTSECWGAFTQGQSARMRATFLTYRAGLLDNGKCDPRPIPEIDAGIINIKLANSTICTPDYAIESVTLKNYGSNNLTSVDIMLTLGGNQIYSHSFSGILLPGSTIVIPINQEFSQNIIGRAILEARTTAPNGLTDLHTYNDDYCLLTYFQEGGDPSEFSGKLDECRFPSTWTVDSDEDLDWTIYQDANLEDCFGEGCSAFLQAFSTDVQTASLGMTVLDFSKPASMALRFTYGYVRRYDFISNTFRVEISTDCGESSEVLWSRSGDGLSTDTPSEGVYTIPNCDQLETVDIDLSSYLGASQVLIRFVGEGRYYSPLILDDITLLFSEGVCDGDKLTIDDNPLSTGVYRAAESLLSTARIPDQVVASYKAGTEIRLLPGFQAQAGSRFQAIIEDCDNTPAFDHPLDGTSTIPEWESESTVLSIFPNPASRNISIEWQLRSRGFGRLDVFSLTGQLMKSIVPAQSLEAGQHNLNVDVSDLTKGTYLVVLQLDRQRLLKKLVLF